MEPFSVVSRVSGKTPKGYDSKDTSSVGHCKSVAPGHGRKSLVNGRVPTDGGGSDRDLYFPGMQIPNTVWFVVGLLQSLGPGAEGVSNGSSVLRPGTGSRVHRDGERHSCRGPVGNDLSTGTR